MWPLKSTTKNNHTFIPKLLNEAQFEYCHWSLQLLVYRLLFVVTLILLIVHDRCLALEPLITLKQHEDNPNSACHNFTIGFSHGDYYEIFSPNFPDKYPRNIDCVKQIEAPSDSVVQLQFHDKFHIEEEPTNCEHDYLEIRDGPYIYSKVKNRFCGNTFPQELTSSGRNLWLRFKTDGDTEYAGFKIVYKFVKHGGTRHDSECQFLLGGNEGTFGTRDITNKQNGYSKEYTSLHCIWNITVAPDQIVFVAFSSYNLQYPNHCDQNKIAFYEDLTKGAVKREFCGLGTETVQSNSSSLYVVYTADGNATNGNFSAMFTAHRQIQDSMNCDPDTEFNCGDNTCIAVSLVCNNRGNCKFKTDEEEDVCAGDSGPAWLNSGVQIILIVGLGLLLSILVPSFLNCYRKMKDDGSESTGGAAGEMSTQTSMGQRTVEGSLHEHQLVGVVSSASFEGQTNVGANMEDDDENGCYVPEVDLSVFIQRSNGGHVILQHEPPFCSGQEISLDSTHPFDSADPLIATAPPPPILPLVPQLRSAGPHAKNLRNAFQNGHPRVPMRPLRTSTPPDHPAHQHHLLQQEQNSITDTSYGSENETNNSFLTFLPPPPTLEEVEESDAIFGLPPTAMPSGHEGGGSGSRTHKHPRHFKAEATIEMQNRRPLSFESTKSAPDVIGRV